VIRVVALDDDRVVALVDLGLLRHGRFLRRLSRVETGN
jgi:hypothetical protein